jgi:hypothetical protein
MRRIITNKQILRLPSLNLVVQDFLKEEAQKELLDNSKLTIFSRLGSSKEEQSNLGTKRLNSQIKEQNTESIRFENLGQYAIFFFKKKKRGLYKKYEQDVQKVLRVDKTFRYLLKNGQMFRTLYARQSKRQMYRLFKEKLKRKDKARLGTYNLYLALETRLNTVLFLSFLLPKLKAVTNLLMTRNLYINKAQLKKHQKVHVEDIAGIPLKLQENKSEGFYKLILGLDLLFLKYLRSKLKLQTSSKFGVQFELNRKLTFVFPFAKGL